MATSSKQNFSRVLYPSQNLTHGIHYTNEMFVGRDSNASFHVSWTGTPTFTLKLQTSNDPDVIDDPSTARWFTEEVTISGSNGTVANGDLMYSVGNLGTTYARLQLNATASGTVTVWGSTKEG